MANGAMQAFNPLADIRPTGFKNAYEPLQQALAGNSAYFMDKDKMAAAAEQRALDNTRADARLGIAQNAENRAADEAARLATDRGAVSSALQTELYNPVAMDSIENIYNKIDTTYKGQDKLDKYAQANDMLQPGGALHKEINSPISPTAYKDRVYSNLAGASPEAQATAMTLLDAKYPKTGTDVEEYNKQFAKLELEKNKALNRGAEYGGKGSVTTGTSSTDSTGSTKSGNNSYTQITAKSIKESDVGENWNPNSKDASQMAALTTKVQAAGGAIQFPGDPKVYQVSPNEWRDILTASVDPKDGNYLFNEGYDSELFKKTVKQLAGTNPGGNSSGNKGPKVTTNSFSMSAQKAINENHAVAVANLKAQFFGAGKEPKDPKKVVEGIFKGLFEETGNDNLKKIADASKSKTSKGSKPAPVSSFNRDTLIGNAMSTNTSGQLMQDAIANPDKFYAEFKNLDESKQARVMKVLENSVVPEGPEPIVKKDAPKDTKTTTPPVYQSLTGDPELDKLVTTYNNIPDESNPVNSYIRGSTSYADTAGTQYDDRASADIAKYTKIMNNKSLSQSERDRAALLLNISKGIKSSNIGETAAGYATVAKDYVADNLTSFGNYFRDSANQADNISTSDAKKAASDNIQKYLDTSYEAPTTSKKDNLPPIERELSDSLAQEEAEKTLNTVLNASGNDGVAEFERKVKEASKVPRNIRKTASTIIQEIVPNFDQLPLEVQAKLYKMYIENN